MDLRLFRSFVMLARERHFTRAAEQLGISTPTLTEQMQSLERKLGARLIDRSARAIALTAVGKLFLEEAEATLRQADRAKLVAQGAARGASGKLEIGYMLIASLVGIIPKMIGTFRRQNPSIDISLRQMPLVAQQQSLVAGRLDVGFVKTPVQYPGALSGIKVMQLPYAVVVPTDHKFSSRTEIEPEELADENFVSLNAEIEVAYWRNISSVMQRHDPRIVKRCDDIISLLNLVAAGYGVSIVIGELSRLNIPDLVFVPVKTTECDSISMIFRRSDPTPALTELKQFVKTNTDLLLDL